jgi:hypothetical protein
MVRVSSIVYPIAIEIIRKFSNLNAVNPCDKARGHASNNMNLTPGTADGDRNRN